MDTANDRADTAQWLLIGRMDPLTPYWVRPLVFTRGTLAEWSALGIPIRLDAAGEPAPTEIWGRRFTFARVSSPETAGFPTCTSRTPIPSERGAPAPGPGQPSTAA
jgi:hypothetical protein